MVAPLAITLFSILWLLARNSISFSFLYKNHLECAGTDKSPARFVVVVGLGCTTEVASKWFVETENGLICLAERSEV